METINLGAADGLPPVAWDGIREKLAANDAPAPDAHNARSKWLTTINEDGSPHVTPVGAMWIDGTFWFQTGDRTRKAHNVARDPRVSISLSTRDELADQLRLHVDARVGEILRWWIFSTMAMQAATIAGVIAAVRL